MSELVLPTKKRKPISSTPRCTIIYSLPKAGKSTIASRLPNALHLDLEKGTEALEVMSMAITNLQQIYQVGKLIKEKKFPYKFIVVDTLSALEELCMPEAERRYAKSADGKDWFLADANDPTKLHPKSGKAKYQNLLNLGYGKGYRYLQDVFTDMLNLFSKMAPNVVLLAHSTTSTVIIDDEEVTKLDLMMQNKTKFVASFKADAIGYFFRKGDKGYIDFSASKNGGGRFRYLEKENILISEIIKDTDGNEELVTYWEKVYAPKKSEKKVKTVKK